MQEGAGSLTPQAKEGGVTRRDAIIIGGAVAAGSLAPPALAADKKRREPVIATNKNMVEITAGKWLKKHPQPGARDLVVGLGGEPYFLLAGKEGALEPYALRWALQGSQPCPKFLARAWFMNRSDRLVTMNFRCKQGWVCVQD